MPAESSDQPLVVVDGWYSWQLVGVVAFGSWLERVPSLVRRLAWRVGAVRAGLLFIASTRSDVVAMIRFDPGWRTLLLLRALLGRRRKLVVFHLLDLMPRQEGVGREVDRVWRTVERWALGRALLAGQVMTEWEQARLPERFGVAPERLRLVRFPRRTATAAELPEATTNDTVVSAGRATCDWPTLFAAAEGTSWPLTVVCSEADLSLVQRLNSDGRATVLSDVAHDDVRGLLRSAAVDVVCLHESAHGHGHVRLLDAADAGTAVVATRTRGIVEYVLDGDSARLVPPGDAASLRAAIEGLLADQDERERLRRTAFEHSNAWTMSDYRKALRALCERTEN